MNTATKTPQLPALTADLIQKEGCLVDNVFVDLWKQMGMKAVLNKAGFSKRSGTPIYELVFILVLWVWLKKDSIAMFSREALENFSTTQKDELYTLMNREDLNWHKLNLLTAVKTIKLMPVCPSAKAFVLDDSIKIRYGKKCQGFPVILTIH